MSKEMVELHDPKSAAASPSDSMETLKIAQQLREYHHTALWEVEKHFTWLFSVILAVQATLLTAKVSNLPLRSALLVVSAAIGLAVAVVAIQVVRREAGFFANAHVVFVREYNSVFPAEPLKASSGAARPLVVLPFLLFAPWKLSIRDAFQLVFLVFAATYLALLIAALLGAV